MRIVDVRVRPLAVPRGRSFVAAGSTATAGEDESLQRLLVEIETDNGLVGHGEAAPLPSWPRGLNMGAIHSIIVDEYRPLLLGQDPFLLGQIIPRLEAAVVDAAFALAPVDMALWDLIGQQQNQPLYRLLGGAVRASLPLHYSIGLKDADEVAVEVQAALKRGYIDFKLKVGGSDFAAELAAVAAVRQQAGPAARIRVDANQAWTVPQAIAAIGELHQYRLELVEQPVAYWDLAGMAAVRRATGVPILADEACANAIDVLRLAQYEAADIVSIKLADCGGIWNARQMAHVAQAAGLPCFMGGMLELEVGASASFQFALSQRAIAYSTGVLNMFSAQPIAQPAWEIRGAQAYPRPHLVGLGVQMHRQ